MIYLDYGATSWPKPESVPRAMREAMEAGSPDRGMHPVAARGYEIVDRTRRLIAGFLGVDAPERIVFTCNATEGLNLTIKGVLGGGGHAVVSALAHNATLRPLRSLEERGSVTLDVVPFGEGGLVAPEEVSARVRPGETRLVVVTQVSNVLGTIQPVAEIAAAVRRVAPEVLIVVDAAQAAGLVDVDPARTGADVIALTGHKGLYGPQGVGAVYVGPRADPLLPPWREGGTGDGGERQPATLPKRLEGGTPNVPGIAGLGAGLEFLESRGGPATLLRHERELSRRLSEALADGSSVRLLTPEVPPAGVVTLVIPGAAAPDVAGILASRYGIACRGGLHCAPLAHRQMGTWPEGAVRFTTGAATTEEDVDRAARAVLEIARLHS